MYLKFLFLNIRIFLLLLLLSFCQNTDQKSITESKNGSPDSNISYPLLFGMNIGDKHYDDSQYLKDLSKLDVVILGFYKGWHKNGMNIIDIVTTLKRLNPKLLIGQYTILNETYDDPEDTAKEDIRNLMYSNDWWLKNAAGEKVQWTDVHHSWEINISEWVTPDHNGKYYPEWIARRDFAVFFESIPFDIWYFDNVLFQTRVVADWDLDGSDDDPTSSRIQETVQQAHVKEWTIAKQLRPDIYLAGNVDHDLSIPNYQYKLNGAFLEGLMGKSWSLEVLNGWEFMMDHYHNVMKNTNHPHLVSFNVWGEIDDYKFLRYALTSCLLDKGYFTFTDDQSGYSSVPWFDEYDVDLGEPLDPPVTTALESGVYMRKFQNGMVLVNPSSATKTVNIEDGYKRFQGSQDPIVNNGQDAKQLVINAKDGIVLKKK